MRIPETGLDEETLFSELARQTEGDRGADGTRTYAGVYDAGKDIEQIAKRAFAQFMGKNGLYPNIYPSLVRLENDLVAMAAAHLGGDDATVGTFTSGGTESILLAALASRNRALARRPELTRPEIVLPDTAHAAFHKAAHLLGLQTVPVEVDPESFRVDPARVREAVTDRTVLLVGSAPSYAHGVIDPIPELAEIARERDLWLHVDACIGGFLLPYLRRLGQNVPPFDLGVPGVTSISMDFHKYAFAPKGASVVLYRDRDDRQHQLYACSSWTGYSVINSTLQSSKSGGPLAASWATLRYVGDARYLELTRAMKEATEALLAGLESIGDVRVLGRPDMTIVAFTSDAVPVFRLADALNARGWLVQEQLSFGSSPQNIHVQLSPGNAGRVDSFLADLRSCIEEVRGAPPSNLAKTIQGALAGADASSLPPEKLRQMFALAGVEGGEIPEEMAEINEVLDALPAPLREKLLCTFLGELFVPSR